MPSLPKESPGVPVSKDRATAQPPGGETVAASTDAGKHFSEDSAQSTQVKVVKEQPVDLSAQASLGSAPPPAGASADAGVIPPAAEHSGATKIDASPVTAQHARPPAQSPDPNPARTISLRPGGTPIATFAATSIESWSLADVPIPPQGQIPLPTERPAGCRFVDRCAFAITSCRRPPPWMEVEPGHRALCVRAGETEIAA